MSKMPQLVTPERQQRTDPAGRWLGIAGGLVLAASALLPWAYSFEALDGMTLIAFPSPLQYLGMVLGLLVAGLIICSRLIKPRGRIRVGWIRAAKAAGTGALVYIALIVLSISLELGGLINVVYGGWLALLCLLLLVWQPLTLALSIARSLTSLTIRGLPMAFERSQSRRRSDLQALPTFASTLREGLGR